MLGMLKGLVVQETGNNMHVRMKDVLPSRAFVVHGEIHTLGTGGLFERDRHFLRDFHHMCERFRIGIEQVTAFLFRNHERMPLIDRLDIEKRNDVIVLVDNGSR